MPPLPLVVLNWGPQFPHPTGTSHTMHLVCSDRLGATRHIPFTLGLGHSLKGLPDVLLEKNVLISLREGSEGQFGSLGHREAFSGLQAAQDVWALRLEQSSLSWLAGTSHCLDFKGSQRPSML